MHLLRCEGALQDRKGSSKTFMLKVRNTNTGPQVILASPKTSLWEEEDLGRIKEIESLFSSCQHDFPLHIGVRKCSAQVTHCNALWTTSNELVTGTQAFGSPFGPLGNRPENANVKMFQRQVQHGQLLLELCQKGRGRAKGNYYFAMGKKENVFCLNIIRGCKRKYQSFISNSNWK